MNTPGTISAAVIALASAALDLLTVFNVFPISPEQKTAAMTVLSSAVAVAVLLIPIFTHNHAMTEMKVKAGR